MQLVWLVLILPLVFYTHLLSPVSVVATAIGACLLAFDGKRFEPSAVLPCFLAMCVAALLPWWRRPEGVLTVSTAELLAWGIASLVVTRIFQHANTAALQDHSPSHAPIGRWIVGYALVAALFSFSAGILQQDGALLTLWHHWGAYIGPAELMLAGAKVLHDIPLQYGFGPTSLIASTCGNDCWSAMYAITSVTTLLWSVCIATMALLVTSTRWCSRVIVLTICLAACFFWTAYPPAAASPSTTPSVAGLRFLPAVLLALYLCMAPGIEHRAAGRLTGHLLWCIGALWSPESAFYVTLIWWPYYLFVYRRQGSFSNRLGGAALTMAKLMFIAAVLIATFYGALRFVYGVGPTMYGFLAYAINPPGPLPISPTGNVWYFVATVILALATLALLWKATGDTPSFRRGLVILLLAYGSFTYFLGRSHDNNILNILPLVVLSLLHVTHACRVAHLARIAAIMAAAILAWTPTFGWTGWSTTLGTGRLLDVGPAALLPAVQFTNPETQQKLRHRLAGAPVGDPADAGRAIRVIQANSSDPITVLDSAMDINGVSPPSAWNAIHGPANFGFIPPERRREFLVATAKTLKRSGWLVVDKRFPEKAQWLSDYDSAYTRGEMMDFDSYTAIHYRPKTAP
ncbi:hypothetical protein BIZ92_03390 [Achromobacter xylosoxidans]|uniref:Uncharacterized protein n=1 Tax=Alcaligenes xylosoxydans xylosoxydans TaxID=85698 RepID=A0A1R1K1T7_ALCXX|nr:hypothetical protein BIZ92_03390 [Achromobacter xylosoxidans]